MKRLDTCMTRKKIFSSLLSCLLLLMVGCDVVPEKDIQTDHKPPVPPTPEKPIDPEKPVDPDKPIDPEKPVDPGVSVRTILLEDYTGIRCTNCPVAATEALALKKMYGDRLIVVAIHAGPFAKSYQGYDLTTDAGTEYNTFFKITSNPQGVISRMPYRGNIYSSYPQWAGAVEALPTEAPLTLDLAISYTENTRAYNVEVGVKRTAEEVMPKYDLLVWLVEDHVFTPQTMTTGKWAYDYDQRHVFRGALNATWGESITLPARGERSILKKAAYTLSTNNEPTNCSVVAMLCDPSTREVVQVVETSLIAGSGD